MLTRRLALSALLLVGCGRTSLDRPPITCGDGFVDVGEECDDGNRADFDGCDSACRVESASCGNGAVEPPEECDDGNRFGGDGCDASCRVEMTACGDGVLQPPEECDDGNTFAGDGCDPFCFVEPMSFCGNGALEPGEECDDGNSFDGDGCSAFCRVESLCGNFVIEPGEECDDGNLLPGDGCDAFCRFEAPPGCGNGALEMGEECDDGNLTPGDGCDERCRREAPAFCGNGRLDVGEECDDGNNFPGDGCDPFCRFEAPPSCGNGALEPGEECDDGNVTPGDGCDAMCRNEIPAFCGDGMLDPGEECDDGNMADGDGCDALCRVERCEPDLVLGALPVGVTVTRTVDTSTEDDDQSACGTGNDVVIAFEVPVDGDVELEILQLGDHRYGLYRDVGSFTCTASRVRCYDPGGASSGVTVFGMTTRGRYFLVIEEDAVGRGGPANIALTLLGAPPPLCGDGALDMGEVCDDGNTASGDGCRGDCLSDETCGNGSLDPATGEVCDDGNTTSGDGCSSDCRSAEVCGNGTLDAGEVCDDGNRRSGDGCSADCQSDETCGNGTVDGAAGEDCDDGNTVPGDGCDAMCRAEVGMCLVDEDLGALRRGVPVSRSLNVATAGDMWDTDCATMGPERVLSFSLPRPGNVTVRMSQVGHHNIGIYQEGQVTERCLARAGICGSTSPDGPLGIRFLRRPAGRYFAIVEANGAARAGTVDLSLLWEGCAPNEDVGALAPGASLMRTFDTRIGTSRNRAACAGPMSGSEHVIAFNLTSSATLDVGWSQAGDHVFGLFQELGGNCDEHPVACHDPVGAGMGSTSFPRLAPGNYVMVIDAHDPGDEGRVTLTLSAR